MAASSSSSAKSGGKRTRRTKKYTPAEALQILGAALVQCQAAGVPVGIGNYQDGGRWNTAIVLEGVVYQDERLLLAVNGKVE